MKPRFLSFALFLSSLSCGLSAEYFVSLRGNDAADGRKLGTAFRTIQKGVDALAPGDTLTIAPGEYRETVSRKGIGSKDVETTIRAQIPGTVVLAGDQPVEKMKKVEGYRFIYETDVAEKPFVINEVDSLKTLSYSIYLDELEFVPGSYFYDAAKKKLYLSSTDLQSPDNHVYRMSTLPKNGLKLETPVRVVVEGLVFTGYNFDEALPATDGFGTRWGVILTDAAQCVVRNCIAYLNGGGIALMGDKGGGGNVIEDCRAYGNGSKFSSEGGNICDFHCGPGDILRRNYVYMSIGKGQRFYLSTHGNLLMQDSIGWGNATGDHWIKGMRDGAVPSWSERIVSLSSAPAPHHRNSLVGEGKNLDGNQDSIFIEDEKDLDWDAEFADAYHFDYRLQSTSRFRTGGPKGGHRGPYPFQENIHFVSAMGSDTADGQSLKTAWKTLAHAAKNLQSGDTLYLAPGTYTEDVALATAGISVRGRGADPVVLTGRWKISKTDGSSFKNLTFTNAVEVEGGTKVEMENCAFLEKSRLLVSSVRDLRILHGVFAQPLSVRGCEGAFLAGNLYAGTPGLEVAQASEVAYSNYNSYAEAANCWKTSGGAQSLSALQKTAFEEQSISAVPVLEFTEGRLRVANQGILNGRGPWGSSIGLYFEGAPRELRAEGPFVHSVSDTTANLEWWTSVPALTELSWGDTPECEQKKELHFQSFAAYSLTGLEPGKTYYYQMRVTAPFPAYPLKDWVRADSSRVIKGSFTTAAAPRAAQEWHVSTTGDNANDGRTAATAWRGLNYAAGKVGPGDTVWIEGGNYHETLWVRATGDKGKPISFRGKPGQRVTFDGLARQIPAAVVCNGKDYQIFDALYGVNIGQLGVLAGAQLALERGGMFVLSYSDQVQVQRCLLDGRGTGYSPTLIVADSCADLLVKNCVSNSGYNGPYFYNCPGLRLENTVLFRNLIAQLFVINFSDQSALVTNNIITDGLAVKYRAPMMTAGRPSSFTEKNNCFYGRIPAEEKTVLLIYDDFSFDRERSISQMGPSREKLPNIAEILRFNFPELGKSFRATDSVYMNPQFAGLANAPATNSKGQAAYPPDYLPAGPLDFDQFFATDPEIVRRGIGLIPADFQDFAFAKKKGTE